MDKPNDEFGLYEWWKTDFSQEERLIVNRLYKPMGASGDEPEAEKTFSFFKTRGYNFSSASPINYLCSIAGFIPAKEYFELKVKLLKKAESLSEYFSYSDRHFLYLSYVQLYKFSNSNELESTKLYRFYCRKMVEIADKVKEDLIKANFATLPSHLGYEGVFEELVEQEKYEDAIRLVIDGREKGWDIQYLITDVWNLIEEKGFDPHKFGLKEESEYYTQTEIDTKPYVRISLLMDKIESKIDSQRNFDKEASEVLETLEKTNLKNYIALESYYKIGMGHYKMGAKQKGINVLNLIHISIEGISPITVSKFYANIGKTLHLGGDNDLAIEWLKKGIEINPKLGIKSLLNKLNDLSKPR